MARVKAEGILSSWSCHLPGLWEKEEEFFDLVGEFFAKKQTGLQPHLTNVGSRQYLVISWGSYQCYIGSEGFGTDLYVSWDLYYPPATRRVPQAVASVSEFMHHFFGSDLENLNAGKAFASVVKDSVIEATEKLMDEANIDKKKLNTQSSGVLGPI